MGTELNKAFSWEIDNWCERNDMMDSEPFSSGGCKWRLAVYPKGYGGCDHLSLLLEVVQRTSVRRGWKRRASYCFVLLNQSGKELYRSSDEGRCRLFCAEVPAWGFFRTLPCTKLHEKGFLENNKITIQVYLKVLEVIHQGKPTTNEMLDFNGFQITASQVDSANEIAEQHPNFSKDVIPKNQGVRTAYMNLLLGLIETLNKSPQSLSVTELSNAQTELTELTEAGFKLDRLKSKLEEISLERKKELSDGSYVQQLEERVMNVESTVSDLQVELEMEKAKSAAVARVTSFKFIGFFIKKFFLSCFSISEY